MSMDTQNPAPSVPKTEDFHILALSGGGYRGLYTSIIMANLEESIGEPIGRRFDLICGTSVGGIIALAIGLEIPMSRVRDMFLEQGADIFQGRKSLLKGLKQLVWAKHSQKNLRKALDHLFGDAILGDCVHPVLIPSMNYSKGEPQVLKTPHHKTFERDWKWSVADVALATSAAPTFLPMARIKEHGIFVDGGIYANAPGLLGLDEAHHFLNVPEESIRLLSIGTMSSKLTARGNAFLHRGVFQWGVKLISLIFAAQESITNYMLQHRLRDHYYQIDENPSKEQDADLSMDIASKAAINTLSYRASASYQKAIGDPAFAVFRNHKAANPMFYHGPNARGTTDE